MKVRVLLSFTLIAAAIVPLTAAQPEKKKQQKEPQPTPLDVYIREAAQHAEQQTATGGSLWSPVSKFADLGRDFIANDVNDLVTIVVTEQASAASSGESETARNSAASLTLPQLAGIKSPTGALTNLLNMSGANTMKGTGATSRQTTISTTVSARVTHVLPNGYLVLEGSKSVQINSEAQVVSIRGVVRPSDLAHDNSVQSNRLAQMEIQLNGKGVVGDAIRRPNILYRVLMGILPF